MKNDGVGSCLIELQSFLLSKIDVDPIHRVLMFLPLILLVACGTRCILFGSLCSLFIGSTDVKNTVCLLLKFCPPGINPELMMECKHPT